MFISCSNWMTIYIGESWSTETVTNSINMFKECVCLVGEAGTGYDANYVDKTYARIDGGVDSPGYFTLKTE